MKKGAALPRFVLISRFPEPLIPIAQIMPLLCC